MSAIRALRCTIARKRTACFLGPFGGLKYSPRVESSRVSHMIPCGFAAAPETSTKRRKLLDNNNDSSLLRSTMASSKPSSSIDNSIRLSDVEATFRQILLDVAEYIDNNGGSTASDSPVKLPKEIAESKIVLRFTGGWVRDKLLGVDSHDIDVGINKMTGYQFGLKVKEYLDIPGNAEKYIMNENAGTSPDPGNSVKKSLAGGLHKIEANPEKSKHLETVTTRILGLDIDLVNLRKETYSEDSRNPQMEFGSPEEDALRRDATVNALFYNLHNSTVEDYTGRGIQDMKQKLIRTPLEPYQTFKDDPLRVLRLIRFASRLGYDIDPAAEVSMSNPEIKEALQAKISRERVGTELEKMLKGPDPCSALGLIHRLDLYQTVFIDPTKENSFKAELNHWSAAYQTAADIAGRLNSKVTHISNDSSVTINAVLIRNLDDAYLMWCLAALAPLADAPAPQPSKPSHKQQIPYATSVAREGIKAPNKVCDVVTAAVRNLEEIRALKDRFIHQMKVKDQKLEEEDATARDTLGMAIRRWGSSWRIQVAFSIFYELMAAPESKQTILASYASFLNHLRELDILEAYLLKPLLDGKALAKALETEPGPWMKSALDVVMAWQLRNPDKNNAAKAIEEIKARKGELTHRLAEHFLRLTIRPLFAKTQHPAVTAQGRKVTTHLMPRKHGALMVDEKEAKPWKVEHSYAFDLLQWVLRGLDPSSLEKNWPLLFPPLLTVMDDVSPSVKAKGCELIRLLLIATPAAFLARTGLGEVIEEALVPCLSYLPTLTPVTESVTILNATYPALIALWDVQYSSLASHKGPGSSRQRTRLLDYLLRKGILAGFAHAGENVEIARVLFSQLGPIVKRLGIESVKHLKDVLPVINGILTDPFSPSCPPLLLAAITALKLIIVNGWPRMAFHRGEILKGLILCWMNGQKDESAFADVKESLQEAAALLMAAVQGEAGIEAELRELALAEGSLQELFRLSHPIEGE